MEKIEKQEKKLKSNLKKYLLNYKLLIPLLFISSALIIYGKTINFFFAQDDFWFIKYAQSISIKDIFFGISGGFIRPVSTTWYFWSLNKLCYLNNVCYHSVHFTIYLMDILIVWIILSFFIKDKFIKVIAALIFAINYLIYYLLSWISGGQDLITFFFAGLTIILFLQYQKTKHIIYYIASLGSYILAVFSKESVILLGGVIFLFFMFESELTWNRTKESIIKTIPFFVASLTCVLLWLLFRKFPNDGSYQIMLNISTIIIATQLISTALFYPIISFPTYFSLIVLIFVIILVVYLKIKKLMTKQVYILLASALLITFPATLPQKHILGYYGLYSLLFLLPALGIICENINKQKKEIIKTGYIIILSLGILILLVTLVGIKENWQNPLPVMQKEAMLYKNQFVMILHPSSKIDTIYLYNFTDYQQWILGRGTLIQIYYPQIKNVVFKSINQTTTTDENTIAIIQESYLKLKLVQK